eukprot:gene20825-22869_t
MDAIIKQAVREEIRRVGNNGQASTRMTEAETQGNYRQVNRLSGLLSRIRQGRSSGSKKRKADKEHRIQIRWLHYDSIKKKFAPVKQKHGGGNRFLTYTDSEPLSMADVLDKSCSLFFPGGRSNHGGRLEALNKTLCDPAKEVISEFPDGGTENFQERAAELAQEDVEYQSESDSASEFSSNLPCLERIICGTCSCTYEEGNECTRCTQNKELEETIKADSFNYTKEPQNHSFPVDESAKAGPSQGPSEALSLQQQQEVRERRLAYLSHQATQETSSAYSCPGRSELAHVGTDCLSHQAELETPISFSFDDLIELPHFGVDVATAMEAFFNNARPTTKKILGILDVNPSTDGERDALKFLQRYIRGLGSKAMLQFLRFTTAMDIVVDNIKLEISFIRSEGLGSRSIAHTCGPLLELPSTYTNFVDLRKEFNNILVKDDWNIDIM